jgi:hypothetical protein
MCKHGLMLLANRLEVFEPVTVKLGRAQEADASVCQQYHGLSDCGHTRPDRSGPDPPTIGDVLGDPDHPRASGGQDGRGAIADETLATIQPEDGVLDLGRQAPRPGD